MGAAESAPFDAAAAAVAAIAPQQALGALDGAAASAAAAAATAAADDDDDEPSVLLATIAECFLYRVPPRPTAAGYTAQSWPGGLDHPAATGFLRITGRGGAAHVAFWLRRGEGAPATAAPSAAAAAAAAADAATAPAAQGHSLVFTCRVPCIDSPRPLAFFMEPVLDSSRYFVLRLERSPRGGASGAGTAFVGIGFRERNAAFELKECIASFAAQLQRHKRAAGEPHSEEAEALRAPLALRGRGRDGAAIVLGASPRQSSAAAAAAVSAVSATAMQIGAPATSAAAPLPPLLSPPPRARAAAAAAVTAAAAAAAAATVAAAGVIGPDVVGSATAPDAAPAAALDTATGEDDDFGDFVGPAS